MPKHEVKLYNSVSGNLHSTHVVEAETHQEAASLAQKESDEVNGYNDVVRPAYRASVVTLDEPEISEVSDEDEEE